jgi:hypothetical protein
VNHRHGSRRLVQTLVQIRHHSGLLAKGLVCNISRDGMFILCDAVPEINTGVEIDMPKGATSVRIPGFVMHRNVNGFGMMFRDLDSSTRVLVDDYLRKCG